jgi:hypothetical protein
MKEVKEKRILVLNQKKYSEEFSEKVSGVGVVNEWCGGTKIFFVNEVS